MSEEIQLSLQDVAACVQIIDIVSKRGAFEGSELGDVGTIRNKLAAFIEANKPSETDEAVEDSVESDGE